MTGLYPATATGAILCQSGSVINALKWCVLVPGASLRNGRERGLPIFTSILLTISPFRAAAAEQWFAYLRYWIAGLSQGPCPMRKATIPLRIKPILKPTFLLILFRKPWTRPAVGSIPLPYWLQLSSIFPLSRMLL